MNKNDRRANTLIRNANEIENLRAENALLREAAESCLKLLQEMGAEDGSRGALLRKALKLDVVA